MQKTNHKNVFQRGLAAALSFLLLFSSVPVYADDVNSSSAESVVSSSSAEDENTSSDIAVTDATNTEEENTSSDSVSDATYTVFFDANGGTVNYASETYDAGDAITEFPTATKDNDEFLGWFTDAEGGEEVTSDTLVNSDMTVYAHWRNFGHIRLMWYTKPNTDTNNYYHEASVKDNAVTLVDAGDTITMPDSETFAADYYDSSSSVYLNTLKATYDPQEYVISTDDSAYVPNVKDNAIATLKPGETFTFPTEDAADIYYIFADTQENITLDTSYPDLGPYRKYCTIHVDTDGGTSIDDFKVIPSYQDYRTNEWVVPNYYVKYILEYLNQQNITKDGFVFSGWDGLTPDQYGRPNQPELRFNGDSLDVTLKAIWKTPEAAAHTLVLDTGTKDADGNKITYEYPISQKEGSVRVADIIQGDIPKATKRDGMYTMWSIADDSEKYVNYPFLDQGTTITIDDTTPQKIIFYVKTQAAPEVDPNGGVANIYLRAHDFIIGEEPFEYEFDSETYQSLSEEDATRPGYVLDGWYTKPDGGERIAEGSVVTLPATIYAHWIPESEKKATVTFDAGDGHSFTGYNRQTFSMQYDKGSAIGSFPKLSYTIKSFLGWYTKADGGEQVTENTIIDSDATYYAHYGEETVILTFDANGGAIRNYSQMIQRCNVGSKGNDYPTAHKNGYLFTGWNTAEDGSGDTLTDDTVITKATYYYAQWRPETSSVEDKLNYVFGASLSNENENESAYGSDEDTNINNVLTLTSGESSTAYLHVHFEIPTTVTTSLPRGSVRIEIPQKIFYNWDGELIGGNNVKDNIGQYYADRDSTTALMISYIDDKENNRYIITNNRTISGGAGLDFTIKYNHGYDIHMKDGVIYDAKFMEDYPYSSYTFRTPLTIDLDSDGTPDIQTDAGDMTVNVFAERNAWATEAFDGLSLSWNKLWGPEPADSDDYVYGTWTVTPHKNNDTDFTTVLPGNPSDGEYIYSYTYQYGYGLSTKMVYRYPKNVLYGDNVTLKNTAVVKVTDKTGFVETIPVTAAGSVQFTNYPNGTYRKVNYPADHNGNNHVSSSQILFDGGQDTIMSGKSLSLQKGSEIKDYSYYIDYLGFPNDLLWNSDGTYTCSEHEMTITDGLPGNGMSYSSGNASDKDLYSWNPSSDNTPLSDNMYRIDKIEVTATDHKAITNGKDKYIFENVSSDDCDLYLRYEGSDAYELSPYAYYSFDGYTKNKKNVVGFKVVCRSSSVYTNLSVRMNVTLLPGLRSLIKNDYAGNKISVIKNDAFVQDRNMKTGEEYANHSLFDYNESAMKVAYALNKQDSSLALSLADYVVQSDANKQTQKKMIENEVKSTRQIRSGIFSVLLPRGADLAFNPLFYRNTNGTYRLLEKKDVQINGVKRPLVRIQAIFNKPAEEVRFCFDVVNSFANIVQYGTTGRVYVAFTDTSVNARQYTSIDKTTSIFPENIALAFNNPETRTANQSKTIYWNAVSAVTWGFTQAVYGDKEGYSPNSADVYGNSTYRYQLLHTQSALSKTDNLVFYDVLENGQNTGWHGTLENVDISNVANLVSTNGVYCNPVVYYSTTPRDQITSDKLNVANTDVWTTKIPENKADITAVAVDCSKDVNGNPFVLSGFKVARVFLNMRAPYTNNNSSGEATNVATLSLRTTNRGSLAGDPTTESAQASVSLREFPVYITKSADPASGTSWAPKEVENGSKLDYTIGIQNDNRYGVKDIIFSDVLPSNVTPDYNQMYVTIDDSKTKRSLDYVNASIKTNGNTLTVTIPTMAEYKNYFFHIPTTVTGTRGSDIINQAVLNSVNGEKLDRTSDATYHKISDNASGSAEISLKKQLNGRDFLDTDKWTFTIKDVDNAPLHLDDGEKTSVTLHPSEKSETTTWHLNYTLDDLEGEKEKQFTYQVSESGSVVNVSNDNDKTFTVTVKDNGTNSLDVSTNLDDDTLSFANTYKTRKITVRKTWDDEDNNDGIRPKEISVQLKGNDKPCGEKVKLTADNGWTYTWNDLPVDDADGEIEYTIVEDRVNDYTLSNTETKDNIVTLTNKHTLFTKDIAVTKKWSDDDNRDGIRPESISVQLYADGNPSGKPVELTADSDWKAAFSSLPVYKAGKKIVYTIDEPDVPNGYEKSVDGFTITNTHKPETVNIDIEKAWDDNNNNDGIRPDSVNIQLFANGTASGDPVELNADNEWKTIFSSLPKYAEGKEVVYTVDELDVPKEYTKTIDGNVTDGFTITNSHTPENTSVTATKIWKDNDNQDGIRPESISVQLYANGKPSGKPVDLTADSGWTYTWNNLLKYAAGKEISYTVDEPDVPNGYEKSVDGFTITNTHTPETTTVSGTKTWDDNDNQDGIRPSSITVNLLANGKQVDSKKVTTDNKWSYSFAGLPKYKDGKEIAYTIDESDVTEGYNKTVNGYNITNTHTPETTSVTVTKKWSDNNNQDGIRPESISVQLYANGKPSGEPVDLTTDGGWTYTWDNLPKYATGKEISYTVDESVVPDGYEKSVDGFTITNTHTPETTTVSGTKTWDDNDNQDGIRPKSVTIHVYDGEREAAKATVTEKNNWQYSFTLPKYRNGEKISYTITEDPTDNYSSSVHGYNITNKYTPQIKNITVTKLWNDDDNRDGIRPDEITVQLYANRKVYGDPVKLTKDDWTHTFTNLPVKNAGKEISYTVDELNVPDGYEKSVDGYTITNTHEPETVDITAEKVWDDDNNNDGIRPESISVQLYADGKAYGNAIDMTADDGWAYTWNNLPKYAAGKEIRYTVDEPIIPDGYEKSVDGYTITNTHKPETVDITTEKMWDDNDNQDGIRPDKVTVRLYADGEAYSDPIELTADNEWKTTFAVLPKYANGKEVVYTVDELDVPDGYEKSIGGDMKNGFTITNSHTPETISINVNKVWDDNNDSDKVRPKEISVQLYADGEAYSDPIELTADNDWKATFSSLPKYADGKKIVYTMNELDVPKGYEKSISGDMKNGFTIMNTHKNTDTVDNQENHTDDTSDDTNKSDDKNDNTTDGKSTGDSFPFAAVATAGMIAGVLIGMYRKEKKETAKKNEK